MWLKTIEVFNEAGERHLLKLFPSDVAPPPDDAEVAQVLVQRVRLERTRQLGPCLLGLTLWHQLQLDDFFAARVDQADADVPWSRIAAILAINRLCASGSELAIEERWYPTTALERHLTTRYGELFAAEFDVLLYDLTSSYVEGAAPKNPMLRMVERTYGHARREKERPFADAVPRRGEAGSENGPSVNSDTRLMLPILCPVPPT